MATADGASSAPSLNVLDRSKGHSFMEPLKRINEGQDVSAFLTSKAYGDVMTFLLQLNRAMFPSYIQSLESGQEKHIQTWDLDSPDITFSDTVERLRSLLDELNRILAEVPPDTGPRRFGNASFRKWYQKVEEQTSELLNRYLPATVLEFPMISGDEMIPAAEIRSYFLGSFGSSQRLDYGSGHELSFLAFLGCIWKLGGFETSKSGNEERGTVLGVIDPYLQLIRRLIKTYTLEPAGSHGVWGLDDHSFIPYIFGSAQYGPPTAPEDQTPIEGSCDGAPDPADVAKRTAVERERSKNMYFGAIGFIHDVKKGPFWEHSPMLYDISGVRAGWGKINKGMIKMYNAEVLSKFPVVQHFRFGSLFSWEQDPNALPPPSSVHTSNQLVRDGPGPSLKNAPARAPPPQEGTEAPWASKPTSMPSSGIGTAAPWANRSADLPNPSVGTSAPWANTPTGMSGPRVGTAAPWANRSAVATNSGLPPTRFPQPSPREPRTNAPQAQMPLRAKDGDSDAQGMPPPTKAPWAE